MISTIAKAHSSMFISRLWTGFSLSVHFAEVLHKEYTMATHMSHSGLDMYTQASWEADNSCLAAHKVQRMLCAMLRLKSSLFISEVKGIPINSHGHLSHSPATNHSNVFHPQYPHLSLLANLLYTFNVCVPYQGDQHIYLIPIVWSIMAHEDNANINSMSTLHSSPFLTNPACKHH